MLGGNLRILTGGNTVDLIKNFRIRFIVSQKPPKIEFSLCEVSVTYSDALLCGNTLDQIYLDHARSLIKLVKDFSESERKLGEIISDSKLFTFDGETFVPVYPFLKHAI